MSLENNKIEILPEFNLFRRFISPNPPTISYIKDNGEICSTCFSLRQGEEGISVDLEHLTNYDKAVIDRTKYRLLILNAGVVQELGLTTEHDPIQDNIAHSLIKGNINRKISKRLASISSIVHIPR